MNLIRYSNGLGILAFVLALGLAGCQQNQKFSLEQVPQEYRDCAAKAAPQLATRSITREELIVAYAELKRSFNDKDRCAKGLVKWIDAQHRAYRAYGY